MPLEIKEIVITASVTESESSDSTSNATDSPMLLDKQDLINECVDQVLEILREKNER